MLYCTRPTRVLYHAKRRQCTSSVSAQYSVWYMLYSVVHCMYTWILTWILGVASKQLRLLHGRVWDSTIVVNSLSPQMSELVEHAIALYIVYTYVLQLIINSTMYTIVPVCVLFSNSHNINAVYMYFYPD